MKKSQICYSTLRGLTSIRRSGAGYTLIEILITLTIIVTIMSISLAGYSRLDRRQKLIKDGENLKTALRDTQSRAFNGEVDCSEGICDCSLDSSQVLLGWYADFTDNKIYGLCRQDISFGEKLFGLSPDITLTTDIALDSSNKKRIFFRFSPPNADRQATICLNSSNDTNTFYVIKVNKAGTIYDAGDLQNSCN